MADLKTNPENALPPGRKARRVRDLARDERGAAALEFAMIAIPLFTMIGAIMEMALVFLISISLADASSKMARQIRVGTYVAPGVTVTSSSGVQLDLTDFKTTLCGYIQLVPSATCLAELQVDVRPFTSFSNVSIYNPISGGAFSTSGLCYYSGAAGSIVVMRTYYLWPLITPFLLGGLQNVSTYTGSTPSTGRWAAVSDTEIFVNEPNPNISNTSSSC